MLESPTGLQRHQELTAEKTTHTNIALHELLRTSQGLYLRATLE